MSSSLASSKTIESGTSRFNSPLPSPHLTTHSSMSSAKPRPYHLDLRPLPSTNRPHCLAKDRLRLWIPATASTRPIGNTSPTVVSEAALDQVLEVMGAFWAESTKELYGTSLLIFHVYCDIHHIAEAERCPVSRPLLLSFLASCAGTHSGSTITNYSAAIWAWHLLHGHPWTMNQDELRIALQGAARLAPRSSKWPKRPPMTIEDIKILRANLDLNAPCDAVIYACIVTVFYCVARLGEFTVPAITRFDPTKHVTRHNVIFLRDQNNLPIMKFNLPVTKCAPEGEDVQCTLQTGCVTC